MITLMNVMLSGLSLVQLRDYSPPVEFSIS